jgi:hypothetical protein
MKSNKIIMWMDQNGSYFACSKIVNFRLGFAKTVEECVDNIDQDVYESVKEAKAVAQQVVKETDLSCVIFKNTKFKSAISGETKHKELEVASAIQGKNEKLSVRQKIFDNQKFAV